MLVIRATNEIHTSVLLDITISHLVSKSYCFDRIQSEPTKETIVTNSLTFISTN